jgi:hypothetical protein
MSAAQPAPILATVPSSSVVNRYSNAYLIARAVAGFGTAIKTVGAVLAVLTILATLLAAAQYVLVAFLFAAVIGALFFLLGIFVSAQGEILKATLDTAVNTSPFLTNDQRVRIMSLPASPAGAAEGSERCPKCGQLEVEIYERSREGQKWICRSCNHTWQVAA